MKILFASDHVGRAMKDALLESLAGLGHELVDLGPSGTERVVYADQAKPAAQAISAGEADRAILCCGGGIGMAIAANKFPGVRAAACTDVFSAVLGREHQDTNVLALGAGAVGIEAAKLIALEWVSAEYEGGIYEAGLTSIAAIEAEQF